MAATEGNKFGSTDLTTPDTGEAVTPSDATELTSFSRYLYVGGAGALTVITMAGTSLTFAAVPAGTVLPLRVKQVMATGTTATSIVSLI